MQNLFGASEKCLEILTQIVRGLYCSELAYRIYRLKMTREPSLLVP